MTRLKAITERLGDGDLTSIETVEFQELSADPSDPAAGHSVMWQSDGTGSGDDGDIMMKVTDSGGTTKTATIIDYSGVA